MTEQEVYDAIVTHAGTMKQPAKTTTDNGCFYRAPNGEKCFVGGLLTDEEAVGLDDHTANSKSVHGDQTDLLAEE